MHIYHCMIELKDQNSALEFAEAAENWYSYLQDKDLISGWRLLRRKFGLASSDHTDFIIELDIKDMNALESAFNRLSTVEDEEEALYRKMHAMIAEEKIGFYRTYPDPIRRERIALV